MSTPIWISQFVAQQNLPAATLNSLTTAINNHDHSTNGGATVPGSALSSLGSISAGAGAIPTVNLTLPSANASILWYLDGSVNTGDGQSATIRVPFSGTITRADIYVGTAPVSQSIIINIRKNGTDIWTEPPSADQRLAMTTAGTPVNTTTFNVTSVTAGDYFNLDVDQIGSGTAGSNLTVELTILKS